MNNDGTSLWQFSEFLNSGPAIDSDGIHHSATSMISSRLYAISPGGTEIWQTAVDDYPGNIDVDPSNRFVIMPNNNTLDYAGTVAAHDTANGRRLWSVELPAEEPQIHNGYTGRCGVNQFADSRSVFTPRGDTLYINTTIAPGGITASHGFLYAIDTDPAILVISSLPRLADITLSAQNKKGKRTITGNVSVENENQSAIGGASVFVTRTLPDVSIIGQISEPGGKGKRGGGSAASFSIPGDIRVSTN